MFILLFEFSLTNVCTRDTKQQRERERDEKM
jgi:hypothetical protein